MTFDVELLAREGHGAIEVDLPSERPLMVMLAGPIKVWWQDGKWGSPPHQRYMEWRDAVRVACAKAGFLVYNPHRAWQGPWSQAAQTVNDMAIEVCDVVLDLTPSYTLAEGTAKEVSYARHIGTPVLMAPPGDAESLAVVIGTLQGLRVPT